MLINCLIFHSNAIVADKVEKCMKLSKELCLAGNCRSINDVLKFRQKNRIDVFFVEYENYEINGASFSKLFGRDKSCIVFIANTKEYASDCFRLDALDYILPDFSYPVWSEVAFKISRWFKIKQEYDTLPDSRFIYVKTGYRTVRVDFDMINYIHYYDGNVHIHCKSETMTFKKKLHEIEDIFPSRDFIRVSKNFIVRKRSIRTISNYCILFEDVIIPIEIAYREKFNNYILKLLVT